MTNMNNTQLPHLTKWPFSLIRSLVIFGLYSQHLLGIGTKNNLDNKTLKMLEPESRKDFNDGILQININALLGQTNYVNAIILLFFTLEREFTSSIVQYMRWHGGANMPHDYNTYSPGLIIDYTGRDSKHKIHFNKIITICKEILWQAPTIGQALNCFEVFCENFGIQLFEQGNQKFIADCRKLIDIANHMRHFQMGFVSYQEAIEYKTQVECFLNDYIHTLYELKCVLRGDFGEDIGTPPYPTIKNYNIRFSPVHNPESTIDKYRDIAD